LDPSSKAILADKGAPLMAAGHPEEAVSLLRQMEASDPSFRSSHEYLGAVYWDRGKYDDALDEYQKEALLRGQDEAAKDVTAKPAALRTGGVQGLLQHQLAAALRAYEHENGSALKVASAYGDLRQRDETINSLKWRASVPSCGSPLVEIAAELR
jgi:tetratricopeptide (TPR) repeat protein